MESKTKHTQCEWKVKEEINNIFTVLSDDNTDIATICYDGIEERELPEIATYNEAKANAKLIAAAPELLEALIEAQITINIYCNNKIGDGSQNGRLMEQIQNAINKATQ